jgi:tetratricopeptide (TPR) repeat protein
VIGRRAGAALVAGLCLLPALGTAQPSPPPAIPGLLHRAALGRTYDAILNADFHLVRTELSPVCSDTRAWCDVMDAVSVWWQIALDPEARTHDERFTRAVERAIGAAEDWTAAEPARAEAWFARGAAYGARAQWHVAREQRLAAARDGKRIRSALERAVALDPDLDDARFGIGMYRYYADVAPAALRMFRWLLLLPGGEREAGLREMHEAHEHGDIIRGEAAYQLHLIYLWYENRSADALTLIRELQQRHPRNPLFVLIEARILDVYFHDPAASGDVLRSLIARADAADVNESALALRRAQTMLSALRARAPR